MKRTKISIDNVSLKKRDFSNSVVEREEYKNEDEVKPSLDYVVKILSYMYDEEIFQKVATV